MDTQTPAAVATAASYVDSYAPPVMSTSPSPSMPLAAASTPAPTPAQSGPTESLEDQNIFHMLGLMKVTDDEKEQFLDELQQVIWEDFVDNDLDLLLTEEEMADFKKIADKSGVSEDDRQSEMVDFLEKLIPDLEKIMLEKALELKGAMMKERIKEMLDVFRDKPEVISQVQSVQKMIDEQKWRSAAELLNSLPQPPVPTPEAMAVTPAA